eukprot:NODE_1633_length_2415_cov_6.243007.p1 GENE.NODE_1633_length_2415_cov_6.243007~~NODE_1633_length_2415_cov_6.243007.p1  ORF type:complete len:463 (+),score=107.68 NODE_1633_length_2415_cov_6.243007:53-1390(+)
MKRSAFDAGLSGADAREVKRAHTEEITRVFVGGLAYTTNWLTLKEYFSSIGDVEFASVLKTPFGSSKGCGVVSFRSHVCALHAVETLNETLLEGRRIMVKLDISGDGEVNPASAASSGFAAPVHQLPISLPGCDEEGVLLPPEYISRVFVGNLSFQTTWQILKDHFKSAGNVDFASVLENPNKTSKGCGMVNYTTHAEALQAVSLLNESILDGRHITVKLDVEGRYRERKPPKPMESAPPMKPETPYYHLAPEQICRIFIGNLAYTTNWQALKDHFSPIGQIEFVSVLLRPDRTSKGCGMVNFYSHEDAMAAVEKLNDSLLEGRHISVKLDVEGKFKARPEPGAVPRVFQKMKDVPSSSHHRGPSSMRPPPSMSGGVGAPAGGAAGGKGSAGVLEQLAKAPSNIDWLTLLGQVAQTPTASQIDWPTLVRTVAASAASTTAAQGRR